MRQQFQLTRHVIKLDNFNPRAEKHGDENVPAGDIRFTVTGHSSLLDFFNPKLRQLLFRKPDLVGEQQPLLEGDTLTELAMPNLAPLKLDEDFPGYRLELSAGLDFSRPLVLVDVCLSNWKFVGKNGGSVEISLSASCHPDEDAAGQLCQMIQSSPYITLQPPAREGSAQMDLGGEGDTLTQQEAEDARRAFAEAAAAGAGEP